MKLKKKHTMKTAKNISSGLRAGMVPVLLAVLVQWSPVHAASSPARPPEKDQAIMLALLLDTSNSMDGLIDQAKSQLWRIVNELAAAKCDDGDRPAIRIALYEYGNDNLPSAEGYVRMVSPLTSDLDLISEKLFSLTTNGGNEYCGFVINKSLKQLDWSASGSDLKMVFIAGNEPFTQGPVPYAFACSLAKEKDVVVNTIFCGPYNEGVETAWKKGADLTGGNYMNIDQNRRTVFCPSPYDKDIDALNERLNKTYIYYGRSGARRKEQQEAQDRNAGSYGAANKAERAVSKSTHAYKNSSWDLVDAAKDDAKVITETDEAYLPAEMQEMNDEEKKEYVDRKSAERSKIQTEIRELNEKRRLYIKEKTAGQDEAMLDAAMINAIREQAKAKDLTW